MNVYLVSAFVTYRRVSVHMGGEYLTRYTPRDQVHPPGADTPQEQTLPGADTPLEQTPPKQPPLGADTPKVATPPWEQTPPKSRPPGSRHPPGSIHPRKAVPPGADTPQSRHSPKQTPPRHRACWEIRSTRGRYASYWNAILFVKYVDICDLKLVTKNCNMTVQSG